jgi:hypothetical protein
MLASAKTLSRLTALALAGLFVAGCVREGANIALDAAGQDATELVVLSPGEVKYYRGSSCATVSPPPRRRPRMP